MTLEPRPCSAAEAVKRALDIAGKGGSYQLGTGDYHPKVVSTKLIDVPWTFKGDVQGSDCAGFALSWCYKLPRHRPGFNRGSKVFGDVENDINCNSALGDAIASIGDPAVALDMILDGQPVKGGDCFELAIGTPQPGDLLVYPTFRLKNDAGELLTFIGHVGLVVGASKVTTWDAHAPRYDLLDVAQCRGPNGRAPGVILTDGSIWSHHREVWPKPEHTCYVLRAVAV